MPSNAIHGKSAVIYISTSASGAAAPVGDQLSWSIDFDQPILDTSPLNNTWKTHVKGMLGWTGAFAGNFDYANKSLWTASVADEPVKFYLYPRSSTMTQYYSGTCWVQLGKIVEGSTTSKASNSWKVTGEGELVCNP